MNNLFTTYKLCSIKIEKKIEIPFIQTSNGHIVILK